MLINRNYCMTMILLSTLIFFIAFAMDGEDQNIVNQEEDVDQEEDMFLDGYEVGDEEDEEEDVNLEENMFLEGYVNLEEGEEEVNPGFLQFIHADNTGIKNSFPLRCYKELQKFCDSDIPNNFGCARAAVILYDENNSQLRNDVPVLYCVKAFFAEVIFPNISHADIISPDDFCSIGGVIKQYELMTMDVKIYLTNMKEVLNSPDAVKKCKKDLNDFRTFYAFPRGRTIFERAFFTKAKSHYTDKNSFGIKYLEYISNSIYEVKIVNPETDTSLKYCQKFNFQRKTRATV